jgi:hypothetical protein
VRVVNGVIRRPLERNQQLTAPGTYDWSGTMGDVPAATKRGDVLAKQLQELISASLGPIRRECKLSSHMRGNDACASNRPGAIRSLLSRSPELSAVIPKHASNPQSRTLVQRANQVRNVKRQSSFRPWV